MKSKDKKENSWDILGLKTDRLSWYVAVLGYFVLGAALSSYLIKFGVASGFRLSDSQEAWAQFGDYFGGATAPFIGFASILLLVATLAQQRDALREQREHQELSARELESQNRTLMLQGFEQSFFSWLKDYKEQVDALSFHIEAEPRIGAHTDQLHGRHAMKEMIRRCYAPFPTAEVLYATPAKRLLDRNPDISAADIAYALEATIKAWGSLFKEHADWLGGLLRTLYGLFRWIDEHAQLSPEEKQHYASIVRARLSNAELRMLFINGMTPQGAKFAKYVNDYALFDNLPNPDLPVLEALKRHPKCPYTGNAYATDVATFMRFG